MKKFFRNKGKKLTHIIQENRERLSFKERRANALALGAEEGRDKLR